MMQRDGKRVKISALKLSLVLGVTVVGLNFAACVPASLANQPPPPPPPPPPPKQEVKIVIPPQVNPNLNTNPFTNGGQPVSGVGQLPVFIDQTPNQIESLLNIERQTVRSPFLSSHPGFMTSEFLDGETSTLFDNMIILSNPSFTQPALRLVQQPASSWTGAPANLPEAIDPRALIAANPGSTVSSAQSITLNPGTALVLKKDQPTTITTSAGQAFCEKGTVALIFDNGKTVAIYSLEAGSRQDVKIAVGPKMVTVLPGQEVLITRDTTSDFAHLNPGGGIAFKKPKSTDLGGGFRAFDAEINIASALSSLKPLRKLLMSDKDSDQKIVRQLIKNSIILQQM